MELAAFKKRAGKINCGTGLQSGSDRCESGLRAAEIATGRPKHDGFRAAHPSGFQSQKQARIAGQTVERPISIEAEAPQDRSSFVHSNPRLPPQPIGCAQRPEKA